MGDPTATGNPATGNPGTSDPATVGRAISQTLNWRPKKVLPRLAGPVRHTVVLFAGWNVNNIASPAEELPPKSATPAGELMMWVRRLMHPAQLRTVGFYGVLGENPEMWVAHKPGSAGYRSTIASAARFIIANYDPRGKLVIYGYSAGGVSAIELARGMNQHADVWIDGIGLARKGDPKHGRRVEHPVRIDLLVTVDAAAGPFSDRLDWTVPPIVVLNRNFYQTLALKGEDFSRGGPNRAVDPSRTEVVNDDWTGRRFRRPGNAQYAATHYGIGFGTNPEAFKAISECLIPTVLLIPDPVTPAGKGQGAR